MKYRIISLFISLTMLLSCNSKKESAGSQADPKAQKVAEDSQIVIAKVNGAVISLEELNRRFLPIRYQYLDGLPPKVDKQIPEVQRVLLDKLIDERLILQEAAKVGLDVSPQELQTEMGKLAENDDPKVAAARAKDENWRKELKEELSARKFLENYVYNGIEVSRDEMLAYYNNHMDEWQQPEQVRVRQILIGSEWEAQQIWNKLFQKGNFEEVAKNSSLSPDGAEGGDLGYFARGQMPPEFDEVAFALKRGEISQVFKSEYGYHIFRLEDHKEARQQPFEEVEGSIRQILLEEKRGQTFQNWLAQVRKRAKIEVNSYYLKAKKDA